MRLHSSFVILIIVSLARIATAQANANSFPNLPPAREIAPGTNFSEVTIRRANVPMKLWVYVPKAPPAGKLPCILIAPAGTRLFHGIKLGEGDRDEHLPYVTKGFAVVAYEVDGELADGAETIEYPTAIQEFKKANGGVANASAAIDYIAAKLPQIDTARIYAVGHSSAATIALQVAQNEKRIAACVAFAPVCNLAVRFGGGFGRSLDQFDAGTMAFLTKMSPSANISKLTCPTMLFTAEDDANVTSKSVKDFATNLQASNKQVKLMAVKTGGHYDSMIKEGIPEAITWLQSLKPATTTTRP